MLIKSKLEIDLQQPGFKKVAYAVQNDSNTRALEISLFLNEVAWEIPSGTTAAISFRKMDLTSGLYDTLPDGSTKAVTFSKNTLTAILAPQVLTCAGKVDVSIALYDSSLNRLGVFPILLYVSTDPSAGKSISNNYYYLSTLAAVNEAIGNLNDLKTVTKESLVAAINEIISLGGGTITDDQIQAAVDRYLETNPLEPTPLDTTLTKEGYAADAKATGEAIRKISEQNPTVDLTGYAKESWVQASYQPKGEYLTEVPDGYAKTEDIPKKPEDIGARPDTWVPTAQEVKADPSGTAANAVTGHNVDRYAHNDIRLEVMAIKEKLYAFLDVDEETLNELSELIAAIAANQTSIAQLTSGKVNVSEIVDNLTTNVANMPLSAAQGVALKALIDAITIPTKLSQLTNDKGYITGYTETDPTVPTWAKQANKPSYSKSEVGLGNVDNVKQYSASNPPPYPVTSVNGKTGAVTLDAAAVGARPSSWMPSASDVGALPASTTIPTKVSQLTNDKGYLTQHQDISGKVDKDKLTLGRDASGLLYLYIDGQPAGAGIELPTGGIDGYITEDKQIIFNNLPDGEYTLAYINDDGSIVPIGAMEKDTNVYYTVTNSLTNCTSNNSATKAVQGGSYSATITAKSGYELSSVKVTMGGTDISSTAVSGGKISIANVTGNIVITAVAEEVTVEIVNLIPISTNADGSLYKGAKGESGYKLNTRVKLSNGDEAVHNSSVCTGFMPCKYNDTLYIKGITVVNDPNQTNEAICFYNSNHAFIASVHAGKALGAVSGGVASVKFNKTGTGKTEINSSAGIAYFRLSANTIDSNSVITINQPL